MQERGFYSDVNRIAHESRMNWTFGHPVRYRMNGIPRAGRLAQIRSSWSLVMHVYCPKCEAMCREDDVVCGQCGHDLKATEQRSDEGGADRSQQMEAEQVVDAVAPEKADPIEEEIGWLRSTGRGLQVLGVVIVALSLVGSMFSLAAGGAAFGGASTMVVLGTALRTAGGIWATLERIARK